MRLTYTQWIATITFLLSLYCTYKFQYNYNTHSPFEEILLHQIDTQKQRIELLENLVSVISDENPQQHLMDGFFDDVFV